ncbi:MAG: LptE family protein [Gemmataceae bacterium]
MMMRIRHPLTLLALGFLLTVLGCAQNGHLNLLGYTSAPLHDPSIKTIYVPIFENATYQRGLEFDFTRIVIEEIQSKTPYRVVGRREAADAELLCKIVSVNKNVVNFTQLGEVRDIERVVGVEVIYRDVRTGMPLGMPESFKRKDALNPESYAKAKPVLLTPRANFQPEIGGSLATADFQVAHVLGVQIAAMMERWAPPGDPNCAPRP